MNTLRVSATKARNNFFTLLDQVAQGKHVIVEKDKKEVAIISPKRRGTDMEGLLKASRAAWGILKDYNPEDNPLRRKGAKKFLGRVDRALGKQ